MGAALVQRPGATENRLLHDGRHPQLKAQPEHGALEWFGRDAHDRKILFVEADLPTHDSSVPAESGLPQMVADHRHRVSAGILIFVGGETAAHHGGDSHRLEIIGGHQHPPDALRLSK